MSVAYVYSHESSQPHSDATWSLAWAGTDTVLSASADGVLAISASSSGERIYSLPPHPVGITSVTTSVDGGLALYNTLDGTVGLVNIDSGTNRLSLARNTRSQSERPWTTSLAPDGQTFASTGKSGGALIHSADSDPSFGETRLKLLTDGPSSFGVCCAYSPDSTKLALGTRSGTVHVFDVHSGALAATLSSHARAVRSIAWAPDSHLLVTGSEDHKIGVHDVRHAHNGRGAGTVGSLSGHNSWILSTDISPDGRYLLSGSADKTVRIWDLGARAAVGAVQDALGEVWSVRWRPGSGAGAFATGAEDGVVRWYRGAGLD